MNIYGGCMNYKFKINEFEGPLDLLLTLIKESKMDIMNIEIIKLTNQYLEYIESMNDLNLVVASEYLVLASELMYLKSKCLLPKDNISDEEFEEGRDNLVNRLIEYKQYKDVTNAFKNLEERRKEVFTKTPSSLKEYSDGSIKLGGDVTLNDLLKAFQNFLDRKKYSEPLSTKITTKEYSVEERTRDIKNILRLRKKVEFFELFDNFSKPYVVVTFLSILEMAKKNEIVILQENNFDKIYCEEA